MSMGLFRPFAFIAILAAGPALLTPAGPVFIEAEAQQRIKPAVRRKQLKALASASPRYRRSRGAQAKPKRHANRLHISKRVRRKHRRAA